MAERRNIVTEDGEYIPPPPEDIPPLLRHGDLLYDPEGYRGTTTYAIVETDGGKSSIPTADCSAYTEIPVEVSSKIEDPVTFYSGATMDELYQGVSRVILSASVHQAVLLEQTGGRPVHESREVWWSVNDGWEIRIPRSPDTVDGDTAVLSADTPDQYLGDADELSADPITERKREINRRLHEIEATNIFRSLSSGTFLSLRDLPTEVSTEWSAFSMCFVRAEPVEGPVERVVLADYTEKEVVFTPRDNPLKRGPYGGVRLWTADNPKPGVYPVVYLIALERIALD